MGGSLTKGLFAGAHGGSRALAEYILNQRSQRNALAAEGRQEARTIATETRQQRAGAPLQQAQVDYYDARAKAAGKDKPKPEPKLPTESQIKAKMLDELFQMDPDRAMQIAFPPKTPKGNTKDGDKGPSAGDLNLAYSRHGGQMTAAEEAANLEAENAGQKIPYPLVSPDELMASADSLKTLRETGAWPEPPVDETKVVLSTQEDVENWVRSHPEDASFLTMQEYKNMPRRK